MPGLRGYVQNHATDRGNVPYAVAERYFDSPEALHEALATPEGQAALADLRNFVDGERTGMAVVEGVGLYQPEHTWGGPPSSRARN